MHRQSLGSPASKLHANGVVLIKEDISRVSSLAEVQNFSSSNEDEEDNKSQKKPPHKTTTPLRPENFVHLIPILTLFCILVLYLSSHEPSETDLAQFKGFKHFSKLIDSTNIGKIQGALKIEIEKGEILAIRSARNLQEVRKSKRRLNRKIGDF